MLNQVAFNSVKIKDKFWAPRIRTTQDVTLDVCLNQCEETGRIQNFVNAAAKSGEFEGIFFNDSDVYKVLEGVAYTLMLNRSPALEARANEIITKIAAAQQDDGYLMCYFTMGIGERWTDMERHEMYCAGHLFEAAVAYYQATGNDVLLNVARRFADHMDDTFGPGKRHWVTGHPEVELALIKLYKCTGEERYLKLAHFLLEERGHGHGKGGFWDTDNFPGKAEYCQDDKPVVQLERVTGHAVRAIYLYTGMADYAEATGDTRYLSALDKLWRNVTIKNMYITGGIGPSQHNEGFTHDYDLPNATAYCETCAAVAMVFWNDRLNNLLAKGVYADVVERAMYNGALSGVSLSGDKFFYVNPLASDGMHHRQEWFGCSCCPTQISRFLPSVGGYVYRTTVDALYVNLFVESEAQVDIGGGLLEVIQSTNYPWDGKVEIQIKGAESKLKTIAIRVPGWCKSYSVKINNKPVDGIYKDGYLYIAANWHEGDSITYCMDMPVEKMRADSRVTANKGRVAIMRGPLVYCAESADNSNLEAAFVSDGAVVSAQFEKDLLGGVVTLTVRNPDESVVRMVPYYAWDNRQAGAMDVWLPEKMEWEGLYRIAH